MELPNTFDFRCNQLVLRIEDLDVLRVAGALHHGPRGARHLRDSILGEIFLYVALSLSLSLVLSPFSPFSFRLNICLFVYLSICLSVYLSLYLSQGGAYPWSEQSGDGGEGNLEVLPRQDQRHQEVLQMFKGKNRRTEVICSVTLEIVLVYTLHVYGRSVNQILP